MTHADRSQESALACFNALSPHVSVTYTSSCALPLQLSAADPSITIASLFRDTDFSLHALLRRYGALLFRGFQVGSVKQFRENIEEFGGEPLAYDERTTPRTQIDDAVYTATEYPAREPIFLHNENAYGSQWPRYIAFYCEKAATSGGAMILADTRDIRAGIADDVRDDCERSGLLYTRRFTPGIGYSWQEAFGVDDASALARVLDERGYRSYEDGDHLVVERVATWTVPHPETHEKLWFNHGVFFNAMSLPDTTRRAYEQLFGNGVYPFQTAYADGQSIESETYSTLRGAYERALRRIHMQSGDVLLVDNMLVAHGRDAYEGERRHFVTMLK